jgi:hypothetical protein
MDFGQLNADAAQFNVTAVRDQMGAFNHIPYSIFFASITG